MTYRGIGAPTESHMGQTSGLLGRSQALILFPREKKSNSLGVTCLSLLPMRADAPFPGPGKEVASSAGDHGYSAPWRTCRSSCKPEQPLAENNPLAPWPVTGQLGCGLYGARGFLWCKYGPEFAFLQCCATWSLVSSGGGGRVGPR